ncbi:MAG: DUF4176 domain-containing protein [Lachnospiraceae bacterium]|nr:DUF4176 domain-containing protein [Lachnospiraceae bacterium]
MIYLPIGTVVKLKNEKEKVMVVSRVASLSIKERNFYFDYVGCLYPSGVIGKRTINFNAEDIEEVLFEGYKCEDEEKEQEIIQRWLDKTNVTKVDLESLQSFVLREGKIIKSENNAENS